MEPPFSTGMELNIHRPLYPGLPAQNERFVQSVQT